MSEILSMLEATFQGVSGILWLLIAGGVVFLALMFHTIFGGR